MFFFFFYSIYNSKTSPSKIVYAKNFAILGTVVQFYHFFINFFLSLSLVFLSFPSLFSLLSSLSLLFCHTISPKFLPISLSFFPLFSPMDHGGGGSWIVAEICSDLMDVVGLIWWIVAKIWFDFFFGISDGG